MTEGTRYELNENDGFSGSHNSRLIKGIRLVWNDTKHWHDRDGLAPPSPMLLLGLREVLQRWKEGKAEIIDTKPLPSVEDLNSTIPVNEWQIGIDGKSTPPWAHTVAFYLINLATGETYTYVSATIGAHIAYDNVREAVTNMRALRGAKVLPLVHLTDRPMKTKFGRRTRPHLEIVGWKYPGEDILALPMPPTPQLSGPATPSTPSPSTVPSSTPQPAPPASNPAPRQPKPSVNLTANDTLAAMNDVKPVLMSEELNDGIPWN